MFLTTISFQIRTSWGGHNHDDYEIPKIVFNFFLVDSFLPVTGSSQITVLLLNDSLFGD